MKPRLQFRLKTMLLTAVFLGCGLGWWLRPYTIEEHWPNGQIKSRLSVQRNVVDITTNGIQQWWWPNGQLARRGESYGYSLSDGLFPSKRMIYASGMPLDQEEMYSEESSALMTDAMDFCLRFEFGFDPSTVQPSLTQGDQFPETPHDASTVYVR